MCRRLGGQRPDDLAVADGDVKPVAFVRGALERGIEGGKISRGDGLCDRLEEFLVVVLDHRVVFRPRDGTGLEKSLHFAERVAGEPPVAGPGGVVTNPPALADLRHQPAPAGLQAGDLVERQLAVLGFSDDRFFIAHGRCLLLLSAANDTAFSRLSEAVDCARDGAGKDVS